MRGDPGGPPSRPGAGAWRPCGPPGRAHGLRSDDAHRGGPGPAHYRIFHNTATAGVFGSAAAAAQLLGLDEDGWVWEAFESTAIGVTVRHGTGATHWMPPLDNPRGPESELLEALAPLVRSSIAAVRAARIQDLVAGKKRELDLLNRTGGAPLGLGRFELRTPLRSVPRSSPALRASG